MMGCETRFPGVAGPFHRGQFSGMSIGVVSKMSYARKNTKIRSGGISILVQGATGLVEVHGCHRPVIFMLWRVVDEDDGGHSRVPPESSGD